MITSLRIQNFKGWKDTGSLQLAPITVFFGTNSSGKSSIGQFLMMLKQTAASPDRNRVLHPGDNKTPVDLGTIEDLMHKHDVKADLQFEMAWHVSDMLDIKDTINKTVIKGDNLSFAASIGFENGKGVRAICRKFKYNLFKETQQVLTVSMRAKEKPGVYQLDVEGMKLIRRQGRVWPLPAPTRYFGFPDEMSNYYQNADALNDLSFNMQGMLDKIAYLGPLREEPKRNYTWSGDTPDDVGTRGERWISAFLSAADRALSNGFKRRSSNFDHLIAEWLKTLGIIHSFEVSPVAKGLRDYRVKVQIKDGGSFVSIPDVGFGISQVLPVIVESFYAPSHSTVIIEQPELHLHPAVQQDLADMFIAASKSWERGKPRNMQFIIESHSEHFLRRLQRRIAEGTIKTDDVAVYFCDTDSNGSIMTPVRIDLFGNILNWPKDFFGDQMTDIAEMQLAGIRRRKQEAGE
jgi:predicted ATPase